MKLWSAWLPDLLPHVSACPNITAENALLRSAQALFSTGGIWRASLAPITLTPAVSALTLAAPDANSEIVRIESARILGQDLELLDETGIAGLFGGDWTTQTGTPSALLVESLPAVRLVAIPTAADVLTVTVSLSPSDAATGIPDDIYRLARECIETGALYRLFGIANQPWSDPVQEQKYFLLHRAQKDAITLIASRKFSRSGRVASSVRWC